MDTRDIDGTSAFTAGVASMAIVVGVGLLSHVRDSVDPTNVALVITLVVVVSAAVGGRFAGVVTGIVGALAYDWFHLQPYGTLRINSSKDIETVILLVIIGAVAGQLTHLRDRHRQDRVESDDLLESVLAVSHVAAAGRPVSEVWMSVKGALARELGPVDCRFELNSDDELPLPYIDSTGALPRSSLRRFLGHGFELPPEGAALDVAYGTQLFGRIVVVPTVARGVSLRERRVAVAVAEQFGIALSSHAYLAPSLN